MMRFIVVFTFFFLLLSCDGNKTASLNANKIHMEIPHYKNGKLTYAYRNISEIASKFNLDSLELGFDSLQIRIWFGYAKCDSGQIFIIKNHHNKWSAESIIVKYLWDTKLLASYISDSTSHINYQSRNWPAFLKELFALKITTLTDMDQIDGYRDIEGIDGSGCSVEVATQNNYRFYGYWYPGRFANKYWQAKNMTDIIRLLEQEFSFKTLGDL